MKYPLYLRIERFRRVEDIFFYTFECSVPPSFGGRTTAVVAADIDGNAEVVEVTQKCLVTLSDELLAEFIVLLTRLAHDEMSRGDGFEIEMFVSDVLPSIAMTFGVVDRASLRFALSHFVDPDATVEDAMIVRID